MTLIIDTATLEPHPDERSLPMTALLNPYLTETIQEDLLRAGAYGGQPHDAEVDAAIQSVLENAEARGEAYNLGNDEDFYEVKYLAIDRLGFDLDDVYGW